MASGFVAFVRFVKGAPGMRNVPVAPASLMPWSLLLSFVAVVLARWVLFSLCDVVVFLVWTVMLLLSSMVLGCFWREYLLKLQLYLVGVGL